MNKMSNLSQNEGIAFNSNAVSPESTGLGTLIGAIIAYIICKLFSDECDFGDKDK